MTSAPSPTPSDYLRFRGLVTRLTPRVAIGFRIGIGQGSDGWHLFVLPREGSVSVTDELFNAGWDAWCDNWAAAEICFARWQVIWTLK